MKPTIKMICDRLDNIEVNRLSHIEKKIDLIVGSVSSLGERIASMEGKVSIVGKFTLACVGLGGTLIGAVIMNLIRGG